MAQMTAQDIEDAKPMASQLLAMVTTMSPAAAVASMALAFAGVVQLAGGTPEAAIRLFGDMHRSISAEMAREIHDAAGRAG